MKDYIPSPIRWVREQVELYEGSGGRKGTTLLDTGLPCVLITHIGNKTSAVRKTPLMRVRVEDGYVLVGSNGGDKKNPMWVANLRANPEIELRDAEVYYAAFVREITKPKEREKLWRACIEAFPSYQDYQDKTTRKIPIFLAQFL